MSGAATDGDLAARLAEVLGHRFADPALLREALTHPSALARSGGGRARSRAAAYERLEFLGDRVLGLVLAELLYRAFPDENEGALAKRLAVLARKDALAAVTVGAGLDVSLVLSRGEAAGGGRRNPTVLADACEAVIGALYLDGGLAPAAQFVRRFWQPKIDELSQPPQDAKTALQEWAQAAGLPLPVYETVRTEGRAHEPLFEVELRIKGRRPVRATGRSKRVAEQAAATALLERLKAGGHD